MLAIRLDKKTDGRPARLASRTGRTKTADAREAIREHLDDMRDKRVALARLARPARVYSSHEVKRVLAGCRNTRIKSFGKNTVKKCVAKTTLGATNLVSSLCCYPPKIFPFQDLAGFSTAC
jgi:RHH-type rel operon transcriptional repressor/antitoxin RelB